MLEHSLLGRGDSRVCSNRVWWIGEIGEYSNTFWRIGEIGECVRTRSGE